MELARQSKGRMNLDGAPSRAVQDLSVYSETCQFRIGASVPISHADRKGPPGITPGRLHTTKHQGIFGGSVKSIGADDRSARYQIAVDGQPRSNRDDKAIAIEAAEYLKYKHPHAEVTVRDLVTGDTITIKALPPGYVP
jgi:hypothetical protein